MNIKYKLQTERFLKNLKGGFCRNHRNPFRYPLLIVVVNCSALQVFLAYNLKKTQKIRKFILDYIGQYITVS